MADNHRLLVLFVYICFAGLTTLCHASKPVSRHEFSCDTTPLKTIDMALITINTENIQNHNVSLTVKAVSSECYKCKLQTLVKIPVNRYELCAFLVDTRWRMKMTLTSKPGIMAEDCRTLSGLFLDHGEYQLSLSSVNGKISCGKPFLINTPMDSNMPLYMAVVGMASLVLVWTSTKKSQREKQACQEREENISSEGTTPVQFSSASPSPRKPVQRPSTTSREYNLRSRKVPPVFTPEPIKTDIHDGQNQNNSTTSKASKKTELLKEREKKHSVAKERLKSLDTFRGVCVVMMVFVNYGAGDYWFLNHMVWNGLTVADFIMPWFVWIMGTSLAFTINSQQQKRYIPRCPIIWKVFKRSAILFCLGLLFNADGHLRPDRMSGFRIPGVLQRYALTYFMTGTLKMVFGNPEQLKRPIEDWVTNWLEWVVNLCVPLVWVLLTFYLPVPGCPTGYLGPGGLAWDWDNKTNVSQCTGGAAMYIDHKIFGADHIYQTPTCQGIYQTTVAYDPEGLLGTLTSCFLCFLGMQAGLVMLQYSEPRKRVTRFIQFAVVTGVVAAIMCQGSKNDGFIPINKNLWSLSFILVSACSAFLVFATCYVTVDVLHIWSGWPFYQPGMNPILLYMGHELINQPVKRFLGAQPNSHMSALGLNIADTAVWLWLGHYLYHHKIFISV